VKIIGVISDESGLVHIGCGHWDLVVPGVCIQEAEYFVVGCTVN